MRGVQLLRDQNYEQPSAKADFLPVRLTLSLRRKRRGKKARKPSLPLVSYTATADEGGAEEFTESIPPENYPPLFEFIIPPPAGLLANEDRSEGLPHIRLGILHLGKRGITPNSVTIRHPHVMGAPEMVVAKMAFCYAVAEKGLDFMDLTGLRDLVMGRRDDVFNFVGSPLEAEDHPRLRLHKFYFRERGRFSTILVHLFASFGGPVYEVVLGSAHER